MKKEIIVSADDLESRVAILEEGELAELHVERDPRLVGSIFKAKVVSVLPGMDAAFADIGLEKNVFLCADDVGYVTESGVTSSNVPSSASISQRLKSGQEVVVQIIRAPVAAKGARATTRLAIPGRYLVLLLSDDRQIGVSRKIEDRKERDRLRKVGEQIRPEGCCMIMRTEAESRGKAELQADLKVLLDLRDRIMAKAGHTRAPAVLHQDLTLTYQVIRDAFTDEVSTLVIDAKGVYDNAVELIQAIAPDLRQRVKWYRGKLPIFYKYGVEGEIDRLLRRRVWIRSGGYISIDQAEAFTAIDINTGRFTGTTGLADTILRTNLEAAEEVARQLRLRDLGGIIVIDFIDMDRPRHRQKVMKAFQEALKRDRQKTNILHLSPLGLIEMTRKRRGESLMGIITETCPQCAGLGRVRTPLTIALKLEREIKRIASEGKPQAILVRAVPRVADIMVGESGERSALLDKATGCPVYIRSDDRLSPEEHEITPTTIAHALTEIAIPVKGEEIRVDHLDPGERTVGEPLFGWAQGYRVQFLGTPAPSDTEVVVELTEAGHSYGLGHVKGYEPTEAPVKPARKRGGRRGRKPEAPPEMVAPMEAAPEVASVEPEPEPVGQVSDLPAAEAPAPRKRRRRGGRGRRRPEPVGAEATAVVPEPVAPAVAPAPEPEVAEPMSEPPEKRRRRRGGRGRRKPEQAAPEAAAAIPEPTPEPEAAAPLPEPPEKRRSRRGGRGRRKPEPASPEAVAAAPTPEPEAAAPMPEQPEKRRAPRRGPRRRETPRAQPESPPEPAVPPRPEPPRVEPPAPAPPAPAAAAEVPRRTGMLRRGARMIGKRK